MEYSLEKDRIRGFSGSAKSVRPPPIVVLVSKKRRLGLETVLRRFEDCKASLEVIWYLPVNKDRKLFHGDHGSQWSPAPGPREVRTKICGVLCPSLVQRFQPNYSLTGLVSSRRSRTGRTQRSMQDAPAEKTRHAWNPVLPQLPWEKDAPVQHATLGAGGSERHDTRGSTVYNCIECPGPALVQ